LVEHTAENRGVAGSIPALAIRPAKSGRRFAATMMTSPGSTFDSKPMRPRRAKPAAAATVKIRFQT
jgi:hypothetical protein